MLPVETPFKVYTDLNGQPLQNGYVYFGQPNQNPITAPVTVYWDAAGTQPAAQPLRTTNGYIMRAGTPANVFVNGAYSELVQNSTKAQVFFARNSADFSISAMVQGFFDDVGGGTGLSNIGFTQSGAGAVVRTALSKARDIIDAADFIDGTPGVSDVLDQQGVQHAVDEAAARGGGRVRVRKPISNGWDLALLSIPAKVIIDDERYSDSGHTSMYATGDDVELRIHGTATTLGEGPAFVGVNNASTGNRSVSFAGRWGPGAGSGGVSGIVKLGVVDGSNWYPEIDHITTGFDGLRTMLRTGYGTVQVNPGTSGASMYTQNKVFVVNNAPGLGAAGPLLEVGPIVTTLHGDTRISAANAPLRHCAADGTINWSWLDQFPSPGQLTLFDHNTSTNKLSFTSTGDTVHLGTFRPLGDNNDNLGTASNRFNTVYAGTGAINTSDERDKQQAQSIPEGVLRAWARVNWCMFKFNDAVAKKGDAARWHFGAMAQSIKAEFEAEGLDAFAYGLLCYDEWQEEWINHPAEYRNSAILDANGQSEKVLIKNAWREKVREAGNRYGVRYEEALALECAYLRSKLPT